MIEDQQREEITNIQGGIKGDQTEAYCRPREIAEEDENGKSLKKNVQASAVGRAPCRCEAIDVMNML